jgi:hypothetical protein
MRNDIELSQYLDPIRRGAWALRRSPFAPQSLLEACSFVDCAGLPSAYRLLATARNYERFHNGEQLAVTLAGRVGNPRVSPVPPLWPLLALLLLRWRDTLSAEQLLQRAAKLEAEDQVHRGLSIVAYLFPELQGWLATVPVRMPLWEKTFAVPLAARKLVLLEKMD